MRVLWPLVGLSVCQDFDILGQVSSKELLHWVENGKYRSVINLCGSVSVSRREGHTDGSFLTRCCAGMCGSVCRPEEECSLPCSFPAKCKVPCIRAQGEDVASSSIGIRPIIACV